MHGMSVVTAHLDASARPRPGSAESDGGAKRLATIDRVAESLAAARPEAMLRALRLLDGDQAAAEELVEDVIGHLWERGVRTGATYTVPYVIRSVQNAAINRWHRQRRYAAKLPLLARRLDRDEADVVAARLEVERLLAQLPPRQREIVTLRYLTELTQEQVADQLGIPQGTVASAAARAVRALRAAAGSAA